MKFRTLLILTAVSALALAGCGKPAEKIDSGQKDHSASQTAAVSENAQGRDMTVAVKPFDVEKYKEQIKKSSLVVAETSYKYAADTPQGMEKYSTDIVSCEVESAEFTVLEGDPYTKLDVKITDTFKGNLKKNDKISVLVYGGYMTEQEYVTSRNLEHRFKNKTKKERENTIIEIKNGDGADEAYPKPGERYIFGLAEHPVIKRNLYSPVMYNYTIFKADENGRYTRFAGRCKKEGKIYKEDSKESFTPDWIKSKIKNG